MPRKDLPGAAFAGQRVWGAHRRPQGCQGRALIHTRVAKRWDLSFQGKETGVCPGVFGRGAGLPPLALACRPAGVTRAGPPSKDEPVCGTSRTRWSGEQGRREGRGGGRGDRSGQQGASWASWAALGTIIVVGLEPFSGADGGDQVCVLKSSACTPAFACVRAVSGAAARGPWVGPRLEGREIEGGTRGYAGRTGDTEAGG